MFESGTYRIFQVIQTAGKPEERLVGRFYIKGKMFHLLEDHDHLFRDSLPDGQMDEAHQKVIWNLMHSPYFRVVTEDEINQGFHDNLVEEIDLGQNKPDAEYLLSGYASEPLHMEMYGENAILDGKRLTDEQLSGIMNKVREDRYKLVPI